MNGIVYRTDWQRWSEGQYNGWRTTESWQDYGAACLAAGMSGVTQVPVRFTDGQPIEWALYWPGEYSPPGRAAGAGERSNDDDEM